MTRASTIAGRVVYWVLIVAILVFLIGPAVLVLALSFSNDPLIAFPPRNWGVHNYQKLAETASWWQAAGLSLGLATVVAAASSLVAVPAAFAMQKTRLSRFPAVSFLTILPLLVPQAAYAIGMYMVMVQAGLLGTPLGLAAAHVAICFPYVFVIVRAQLSQLSPDLDLVAMTLGASRRQAWLGITLPLLLPTIFSGALFAFLISFDEAVFANFLSSSRLITLPKSIFDSVRLGVDPVITAVAAILMMFTALLLGAAAVMRRKRAST